MPLSLGCVTQRDACFTVFGWTAPSSPLLAAYAMHCCFRLRKVDADVYAHEWQVDQVKDDGCGQCPQHEPFAAMRDALNKTGRPIFYAIHSSIIGTGNPNATVANMWRTGRRSQQYGHSNDQAVFRHFAPTREPPFFFATTATSF